MKDNSLQALQKTKKSLPFWALILIMLGIVGVDQLTKWLAVEHLMNRASLPLWEGVLHFTFVKNEGAAFGMLSNNRWVFMVISAVAIIGISVYLFGFCKEGNWVKISLAMIVGGGIGNMIDRIALGYVVDFIDFTLINFAVFNVADSFVTVGAGILIVYLIAEQVREIKQSKEKSASRQAEPVVPSAEDVKTEEPSNGTEDADSRAHTNSTQESEHGSTDVQ